MGRRIKGSEIFMFPDGLDAIHRKLHRRFRATADKKTGSAMDSRMLDTRIRQVVVMACQAFWMLYRDAVPGARRRFLCRAISLSTRPATCTGHPPQRVRRRTALPR